MFDLNMAEVVVLVILAIVMFGPEKLPELARKTARVLAYLRQVGNDARGQLRRELGPEFDDIRLSDLRDPKSFVARKLAGTELEKELNEAKAELSSAGALMRGTLEEAQEAARMDDDPASSGSVESDVSGPQPDDFEPARTVAFDPEAT